MTDETEIITKPPPAPTPDPKAAEAGPPRQTVVSTTTEHPLQESQFGRISIRAWLAVMVVGTMCSVTAYQVWKTGTLDESFKVAYGLVIGLYFGQKR